MFSAKPAPVNLWNILGRLLVIMADYWTVMADYWLVMVDYWVIMADYWLVMVDYWVVMADYWWLRMITGWLRVIPVFSNYGHSSQNSVNRQILSKVKRQNVRTCRHVQICTKGNKPIVPIPVPIANLLQARLSKVLTQSQAVFSTQ